MMISIAMAHVSHSKVFLSGELPRISEDTSSRRVHNLPGGSWTSGVTGVFVELSKSVIVKLPFNERVSPAPNTSNAIDVLAGSINGVLVQRRNRTNYGAWVGRTGLGPRLQFRPAGSTLVVAKQLVPFALVTESVGTGLGTNYVSHIDVELEEFIAPLPRLDQRLAARQRALLERAGVGLTITQVAQRSNVSRARRGRTASRSNRLLAVPNPDGETWAYPACQLESSKIVPGLAEVLSDFPVKSAWIRLYVLIGEDPALGGRTPIEALRNGDLDMVREIVSGSGEQGGA